MEINLADRVCRNCYEEYDRTLKFCPECGADDLGNLPEGPPAVEEVPPSGGTLNRWQIFVLILGIIIAIALVCGVVYLIYYGVTRSSIFASIFSTIVFFLVLAAIAYGIYRFFGEPEKESIFEFYQDAGMALYDKFGLKKVAAGTAIALFVVSAVIRFSGPGVLAHLGIGWGWFLLVGLICTVLAAFEQPACPDEDEPAGVAGAVTAAEEEKSKRLMTIGEIAAVCLIVCSAIMQAVYIFR